jgi:HIP---CoA ligase
MLEGEDLPHLERIVALRTDGPVPAHALAWGDFSAMGDTVEPEHLRAVRDAVAPDDLSDVLFTSGTTGRPKGVLCTHAQALRAYTSWADVVGLRDDDRYLIVNPFFHAFGYKAGILACCISGATMVPLPVFDVPAVMATIAAERVTMVPGPPTLYQTILNHPDRSKLDASTLRLAVTGAAAIPVSLVEHMRDDLGFETVITGYGLTEASGIVAMCRHDDDAETIATTSGRAIPDVEVRVVGEDGSELPRGAPGEIVVRGYNVMQGYFEDPEQTAEAIDEDGWLHTGDIGTMDDRGYLKITDRKKDMFIVGGFNAYPAEIESLLLDHPDVGQVAVVGVPDDRMGEVAAAFVVPAPGAELRPDEVIAWAREHMANFKVPRQVVVVDALPLNASGKVLKYELRARAAGGRAAP